MKTSPCCQAKIDIRGGGYDDEDVCPVEDYCTKCGQVLAVNGEPSEIINIKNGKKLKVK